MKTRLYRRKWMLTLPLILLFAGSCTKENNNSSGGNTITDVVSGNASFSLLKTAVVKAGLATTLSGSGTFTVFAPDDNAFQTSGISASTIGSLSSDQLKNILLYHTLTSKIMSADVPAGPNASVKAANGGELFVTKNSSGVFVNGVKVTQADVPASNGVIHVINRVLLPPAGNLVQVTQSDTGFSYLVAAVLRASQGSTNVAQVLSGNGPFTVFAPTNQAFRNAGFSSEAAINAADPNTLAAILTYHVIGARVFSSDLVNGAMVTTLNGGKVTIGLTNGATVKGNSNKTASAIIATNIMATNGVVHVIDQVLLP
ncbi:fasciclin domain-containing protein [Asinibacterium sp. OR53]|uniref:fasciclin domain-containing protein n=1 Tax=Asinibacterium sp. OR53 TaxID=925409 RepID=UPI000479666E|nr:fasciclin domain-containing protein [Asinibacterium sp. OR53]